MYLESKVNIDEHAFIQILRSHYKEKDSTSVFQEMSNSIQLPSESELDFCLHVMSLRERVLSLSREEACPFDEAMVRKRFFHEIFTGLKHNNMHLELKQVLTTGTASDEDLLHEISVTASIEMEHLNKFQKKAIVNEVHTQFKNNLQLPLENLCDKKNEQRLKENSLLTEIKKLNEKMEEFSSVCEEVSQLKELDLNREKSNLNLASSPLPQCETRFQSHGNVRRRLRRVFRCQDCERANNLYCDHCFLCGSTYHRKNECSQKSKND